MSLVQIYGLYEPDGIALRYVGKANNAERRLKTHLLERGQSRPVNRWIKALVSRGQSPVMRVLENVPNDQWEQAERRLIAEHRKTSSLLNVADGGAMPSQTDQERKKAAKASNSAQAKKSPAELEFVRAKQDVARLLSRFMKDGAKTGDYYRAYMVRFYMRACYASRPERHATWANI